MGEATRRREVAHKIGPWPGGHARCPKCFGLKVGPVEIGLQQNFYARNIIVCAECGAAWEPIDEAQIWDRDDPACSTSEPCDNCAFRPGSNEQRDKDKWTALIDSLKDGGAFYCHKGVPIAPGSKDGFAYPKKTVDALGLPVEVHDTGKLRLCRGYLNALGKWWRKPIPPSASRGNDNDMPETR